MLTTNYSYEDLNNTTPFQALRRREAETGGNRPEESVQECVTFQRKRMYTTNCKNGQDGCAPLSTASEIMSEAQIPSRRSAFASVNGSGSGCFSATQSPWDTMSQGDLRAALIQLNHDKNRLTDDLRMVKVENASLKRVLRARARISATTMLNQSGGSPAQIVPGRLCSTGVDSMILESRDDSLTALDECAKDGSTISVILSQSMTVLSQINNQELIEKVCAGTIIVKQLAIGNVAGYVASHLVRKFGKVAAGSFIGSLLMLKLAHHKGYISVDWNRIQTQLEATGEDQGEDEAENQNDFSWFKKKINDAKTWSRENSYVVLGFWSGFLLHNLQ